MIELYYRMLKHDPDGVLVKDTGLMPSGSYVIQFLELIQGLFDGITSTATRVTGAEGIIVRPNEDMYRFGRVGAAALDDSFGVVVGTNAGTTAEDNENYALDTKILHSAVGAAGEMNYRDVTFVAPRVVGPNVDFDITRAFINETGFTITVKEIGIIANNNFDTQYFLLLRDVVTDEPVDDAETLTVIYVLRTTV